MPALSAHTLRHHPGSTANLGIPTWQTKTAPSQQVARQPCTITWHPYYCTIAYQVKGPPSPRRPAVYHQLAHTQCAITPHAQVHQHLAHPRRTITWAARQLGPPPPGRPKQHHHNHHSPNTRPPTRAPTVHRHPSSGRPEMHHHLGMNARLGTTPWQA